MNHHNQFLHIPNFVFCLYLRSKLRIMKTREEFHKLIDTIEDDEVLQAYYQLISGLNAGKNGQVWNSLSEEEQEEVLASYEESLDKHNLIDHSLVAEEHAKWLKK